MGKTLDYRSTNSLYFGRKVKKLKHHFLTAVTASLSSLLSLISTWFSPILTRTVRERHGGRHTYGVEETAGVYYRISRSGASAPQRVPGDGESFTTPADSRPCTPE